MTYQIYIDDELLSGIFNYRQAISWLNVLRRNFPGHPIYVFEVR